MMYVRCFTNSKWLTKIKTQDNVFIKWRVFSLPQTVYSRHQHAQNVSLLGMMKHWVPRILGLHGRQSVFYWNADTGKQITLISLLNKT